MSGAGATATDRGCIGILSVCPHLANVPVVSAIIEKLAEQNAQIVATVGALRIGAQRLAWTCVALGISLVSLAIYVFRH